VESNPGAPKADPQSEQQSAHSSLSLESLANMIMDLKTSLNTSIEDGNKVTHAALSSMKDEIGTLNKNMSTVNEDLCLAKNRISELENLNNALVKKVSVLEAQNRKNNVIIFDASEGTNTLESSDSLYDIVIKFSDKYLDCKCSNDDFSHIYRVGKNPGKRPILVSFIRNSKKSQFMFHSSKLKDTPCSISNDLTPEARAEKKQLLLAAKEARNANLNTKITKQGLLVNDILVPPAHLKKTNWLNTFKLKNKIIDHKDDSNRSLSDNEVFVSPKKDVSKQVISGNAKKNLVPPGGKGGVRMSRANSMSSHLNKQ
jgi:hypothetical protein